MKTTVYADGACSPNPGVGGWGCILVSEDGTRRELSGYAPSSTNNQMELMAVIRALEAIEAGGDVTVVTDSQYVVNGMRDWMAGWVKRGWRTASGGVVLNKELWVRLNLAASAHTVTWQWVRGHSGHVENENADKLAVRARLERRTS